jgi:hypothetical protein
MSIFYTYPDKEAFWADFSKPQPSGEMRHLNWGAICTKAKKIRKDTDSKDALEAKKVYAKEFDKEFGYRRGSQWHVLKSEADIARRYRDKIGNPQPWDDHVYNRK